MSEFFVILYFHVNLALWKRKEFCTNHVIIVIWVVIWDTLNLVYTNYLLSRIIKSIKCKCHIILSYSEITAACLFFQNCRLSVCHSHLTAMSVLIDDFGDNHVHVKKPSKMKQPTISLPGLGKIKGKLDIMLL